MKITEVTEDVAGIELPTPFAVGPVNVYLIKKEGQLLLVDAGVNTDQAWDAFLKALKEIGLSVEDISTIFLTHHHPDHTGLITRLPGRQVLAHGKVAPWLERDTSFLKKHEAYLLNRAKKMGVPESILSHFPSIETYMKYSGEGLVSKTLTEKDHIPGFKEWEIIETLGHAQSHFSLFRREDGCLIAGDAILERITSNALMESPYNEGEPAPKPLIQYRETLKKSMTLPIKTVLPGHGNPFTFSKSLISHKLRGQERRRAAILSCLTSQAATPFEVAKQLFPDVYLSQLDLVLSEIQGHLEWLEADDLIKADLNEKGQLRYSVNQPIFGDV